jgi:hypothetical protein
MKIIRFIGLILLGLWFFAPVHAQKDIRYEDWVYEKQVASVQLYKGKNELSYPVLELNQPGQLTLEFDELGKQASNLTASIVLCDADWSPSSYFATDYYEGFTYEPINNVQMSANTRIPYIHYQYTFPTNGRFKKSGNYLLKVYRDNDENDLLLTRRFIVIEDLVRITTDVGFTANTAERFRLQAVNFYIQRGAVDLLDPFAGVSVCVMQNFRWGTMRAGLKPAYVYTDKLEYRFDSQNDFDGGNEYRFFDLRNLINMTGRMRNLSITDSGMFVALSEDRVRNAVSYSTEPDFNGNFYIGTYQTPDRDLNADYAHVQFLLRMTEPLEDGDVYLFGAMTDWRPQERFKMYYSFEDKCYHRTVLLKQGIYNYQYVVWNPKWKKPFPDEERLEGSHFETENSYTIFVYYKSPSDRAARIVGLRHVNYYD